MDRCGAEASHLAIFDRRPGRWQDKLFHRRPPQPAGYVNPAWPYVSGGASRTAGDGRKRSPGASLKNPLEMKSMPHPSIHSKQVAVKGGGMRGKG